MKKLILVLVFGLVGCENIQNSQNYLITSKKLAEINPSGVGMSEDRLNRIKEISDEYITSNKVPGIVTMVARKGKIVYKYVAGAKGIKDSTNLKEDDLFRIYSMTKPITAIAAMQLYEDGKFHLKDPISKFIPELKRLKYVNEDGEFVETKKEITMQQLLTHTAGFSYGFNPNDTIDKLYNKANLWESKDLDEFTKKISKIPLKFEPGNRWHYSIAVDLTGLIVERLSNMSLDEYFYKKIFKPLGMNDTFFEVPENKKSRFLPNHYYDGEKNESFEIPEENRAMSNYYDVSLFSGGGGLVSTAMDYMIFAECLRNGGSYNGKRIISPKTIDFMIKNHLEASISNVGSGESPSSNNRGGFGFGLGFGLMLDSSLNGTIGSNGEYSWGGAAGTIFWIDPKEEIVVVSMIQLMNSPWSLRQDLKVATYQAIDKLY